MDDASLDEYYRLFFRANRLYEEYARSEGMDAHVLFLYRLLVHEPAGLCQRDICACLGCPKQTMSRTLKGLRAAGFIKVAPSTSDAREKIYSLTAVGREAAASVVDKLNALENACLEEAGPQIAEVNGFNARYLDALEAHMRETKKGDE